MRLQWLFRWAAGVGLGLRHSCAMPCAGVVIEPLRFWMVLWCGHAVLPFPSFGLVFSFHLVCSWVSLALAATVLFSCPYCAFLLCLYWVLGCEYACHTLLWSFFMGILLPSLSPWSICPWCRLSSQSLEPSFSCSCAPSFFVPSLLWLWFDLLFLFSWGFLRLPSGRCVRRNFFLLSSGVMMCCRLSNSFYLVVFLVFVRCGGLSWDFSFFVGAGYGAFCLRSLIWRLSALLLALGSFVLLSLFVAVCLFTSFFCLLSSAYG